MTVALHPDPVRQVRQVRQVVSTLTAPLSQVCAVRLIDRRTGQTHRINGSPLVMFSKTPEVAVAELLSGRDAAVWEARVEPIGPATRLGGGRT